MARKKMPSLSVASRIAGSPKRSSVRSMICSNKVEQTSSSRIGLLVAGRSSPRGVR